MSYELMVKGLPGGAAHRVGRPNPAMQRTGNVPLDEGRPWSGDLYDQGPVTDPAEAYAHFTMDEDSEAWLDRGDDGTLIGWVREGNDVYRYNDAEAWGLDVDGAGMSRADAPVDDLVVDPAAEAAPAAAVEAPAVEADGGMFDADPMAETDAQGADPLALEQPDAPEGFDDEADPATTEADPTAPLEDPTTADDEATDVATNPFEGLTDDDADLNEPDPAAADAATGVAPTQPIEEPVVDADAAASEGDEGLPVETEEDEDAPEGETEEEKRKRLLHSGRIQVKHLQGEHNQQSHGNRIGTIAPRARRAAADSTPGAGDAPLDPKAREAAKARLDPDTIARLSDDDLNAVMESDELYATDTMMAAAVELDSRDPLHDRVTAAVGDAAPGSVQEAAAFSSVIPSAWATWAGRGAKGKRPGGTRKEQIASEWMDYWLNLQQRAASDDAVKGTFLRRGVTAESLARVSLSPDDLFNGRMSRAQVRKYGSDELREWLDKHGMTMREWLAEFYPSYQKVLRALGSGEALSENG